VSTASLGRQLDALRRSPRHSKAPGDGYVAAVHEADRRRRQEKEAATVLVAFAQALAGTVLQLPVQQLPVQELPVQQVPVPAREAPLSPATRPAPRRPRPVEPEPFDPRAEVTWEEAMRQALRNRTKANLEPKPPACLSDPDDPWGLIVPSYAGEAEK
jgi:hypothetical protein